MLQGFKWPEIEDPPDKKVISDIKKFGCHIVGIFEEGDSPEYAFSVGLYLTHLHPEIVIFGLTPEVSATLINDINGYASEGKVFQAGETTDDLFHGLPAAFQPVPIECYRDYLGYANWFYRSLRAPYPCLQLVWPDREGVFPWQSGYDERFHAIQPLLYERA